MSVMHLVNPYQFAPSTSYRDTVLNDAPLLYWSLDETSGSSPNLGSGGTADMASVSGVTQNQPALAYGKSWDFSGSSSTAATTSTVGNLAATHFTFECWISAADAAQDATIMDHTYNPGSATGVMLGVGTYLGSSKQIVLTVRNSSSARRAWATTADIIDGGTHHIVASYSAGTPKIYVDGVDEPLTLVYSSGTAPVGLFTVTNYFYLGSQRNLAQYFDGTIDEPAVWYGSTSASALSLAQAQAHYAAGL